MHDIVAHHLTVMVSLSDAAKRLVRIDVDRAEETISNVSATGRVRPRASGAGLRASEFGSGLSNHVMITVVLVDDQELLRTGLRIVIDTEEDLTVIGEAADGREAIRLLGDVDADVVLMDIRMPGMDGIAATAEITMTYPRSRVIILTTYDIDQYVYDGLRAGASGFLLKDATPESLTGAIRTVACGESGLAPTATTRLIRRFATLPDDHHRNRPAQPEVLDSLTEREREVFELMAQGLSNREIAAELFLSEHTVKIHVARVLSKLHLRDRVQAVVLAYESGLVTRDNN